MKRILLPRILLPFFVTALFLLSHVQDTCAQLHLLTPDGGEKFKVGSTVTIRWEGVSSTAVVSLDYSTDLGQSWNPITSNASGLQYNWVNIPNTVSDNCLMRITGASTSTPEKILLPSNHALLNSAEFSSDGNKVIGAGIDGFVYIWDSKTKEVLHKFLVEDGTGITPNVGLTSWATLTTDGSKFAVACPLPGALSEGNRIKLFDATTGALIRTWDLPKEPNGGGFSTAMCRFSPDGTLLATTGKDSIYVFNVTTGALTTRLGGHCYLTPTSSGCDVPSFFDWSKSGTRIISASAFYDEKSPAYVLSDPLQSTPIDTIALKTKVPFFSLHGTVAFSPDATKFVGATTDTTVRVWDIQTKTVITSFKPNTRALEGAVFSPDGSSILTLGSDHLGADAYELKLWNASNGSFIELLGTDGAITGPISFNFDGSRVVAPMTIGAIIFQAPQSSSEQDISDLKWAIIPDDGSVIIVSAPKVQGKVRDVISVPITVDDPAGASAQGVTRVDLSLQYSALMLEPVGTTPQGTINADKRVIDLSLPLTASSNVLTTLDFRATLGDDSVTALDLFNLRTDKPIVSAVDVDGEFKLLDLCREGGPRLLNPNGMVSMSVIHPPTRSGKITVELHLLEDGQTKLYLTDFAGRRIRTLLDQPTTHGEYTVEIDPVSLPSGRYYVLLQSPTVRRIENLEVIR